MILELAADGMSVTEAAKKAGCSRSTAYYIIGLAGGADSVRAGEKTEKAATKKAGISPPDPMDVLIKKTKIAMSMASAVSRMFNRWNNTGTAQENENQDDTGLYGKNAMAVT